MESTKKEFITGLQHIGLPTNDLDETIRFYELLGFENVYQTVNEKANERVAFLQFGSLMVETYENRNAALKEGAWDHVALDVTDIDAAYQFAKEQGFPFVEEEIQFLPFWSKGVKYFVILGPNKEKVEFCQKL